MKEKVKHWLICEYNGLVDLKDWAMVRVWAVFHEKAYRDKTLIRLTMLISLIIIIVNVIKAIIGMLTVFDLLIGVLAMSLFIYIAIWGKEEWS